MSLIADISAYANPFGTPAKGKWNLSPGTWTDSKSKLTTVFFAEVRANDKKGTFTAVDQIQDSGHRRLAVYEYPYVDGQKLKDLGRKGETYTFNIKFHGPDYQSKLKEFYNNVYRSNQVGKLQHPVLSAIRGAVDCRLQSFEPIHRAEESNSVTFKATFVEDNSATLDYAVLTKSDKSAATALQNALNRLVQTQAFVTQKLTEASALLGLPSALTAAMNSRKTTLMGSVSGLLGQLGATFATGDDLLALLSIGAGAAGGVTDVNAGAVVERTTIGSDQLVTVPPVFQTGLDSNAQTLVNAQTDAFVNANQISPQQAVFTANQSRSAITDAIAEAEKNLGNEAYDIVVSYRSLAVTIQETVEACITSSQSRVKVFVTTRAMSLRAIAFANGLNPDRQNDIESLNPYLGSINFVPKGSSITVPAV
jgi:hypothetical protein